MSQSQDDALAKISNVETKKKKELSKGLVAIKKHTKGYHAKITALRNNQCFHLTHAADEINNNNFKEYVIALGKNSSLKTLEFLPWGKKYIRLTKYHAHHLAKALVINKSLKSLNLDFNEVGNEGAASIASALKVNKSLRVLSLNRNEISDEGIVALADALVHNSTLQELDISGNKFGIRGLKALTEMLKTNKTLLKLRLIACNSFSDPDSRDRSVMMPYIAEILVNNQNLISLGLCGNGFIDQDMAILAPALEKNFSLHCLSLRGSAFTDVGMKLLITALQKNQSIHKLEAPHWYGQNEDYNDILSKVMQSRKNLPTFLEAEEDYDISYVNTKQALTIIELISKTIQGLKELGKINKKTLRQIDRGRFLNLYHRLYFSGSEGLSSLMKLEEMMDGRFKEYRHAASTPSTPSVYHVWSKKWKEALEFCAHALIFFNEQTDSAWIRPFKGSDKDIVLKPDLGLRDYPKNTPNAPENASDATKNTSILKDTSKDTSKDAAKDAAKVDPALQKTADESQKSQDEQHEIVLTTTELARLSEIELEILEDALKGSLARAFQKRKNMLEGWPNHVRNVLFHSDAINKLFTTNQIITFIQKIIQSLKDYDKPQDQTKQNKKPLESIDSEKLLKSLAEVTLPNLETCSLDEVRILIVQKRAFLKLFEEKLAKYQDYAAKKADVVRSIKYFKMAIGFVLARIGCLRSELKTLEKRIEDPKAAKSLASDLYCTPRIGQKRVRRLRENIIALGNQYRHYDPAWQQNISKFLEQNIQPVQVSKADFQEFRNEIIASLQSISSLGCARILNFVGKTVNNVEAQNIAFCLYYSNIEIHFTKNHRITPHPNRNSVVALYLNHNNIGPEGAIALAKILEFPNTISTLDLANNRIGAAGVTAIMQKIRSQWCILRTLNLSGNNLGEAATMAFVNGLHVYDKWEGHARNYSNHYFESLDLSDNNIDDGFITHALPKLMKRAPKLTRLNLSHNKITDDGASQLASMLQFNYSLRFLDLSFNPIQAQGINKLKATLPNTKLCALYIFATTANLLDFEVQFGIAFQLQVALKNYLKGLHERMIDQIQKLNLLSTMELKQIQEMGREVYLNKVNEIYNNIESDYFDLILASNSENDKENTILKEKWHEAYSACLQRHAASRKTNHSMSPSESKSLVFSKALEPIKVAKPLISKLDPTAKSFKTTHEEISEERAKELPKEPAKERPKETSKETSIETSKAKPASKSKLKVSAAEFVPGTTAGVATVATVPNSSLRNSGGKILRI